ncbi:MAG: zinc ribbon domain-containing protein [Anaerofustis sp.]
MNSSACNKKQWRKSLLKFLISGSIAALLIAFAIFSFQNNVLFGLFLAAFSGFPLMIALGCLFNLTDSKKIFDILCDMDEMGFPDFAKKLNSEKESSAEILNRMIECNYLIAYLNDTNIVVTNKSRRFDPQAYLAYKEKLTKESNLKQERKKEDQKDRYLEKMMRKGKAVRCPDCGTVYPKNKLCPNCESQTDQTD